MPVKHLPGLELGRGNRFVRAEEMPALLGGTATMPLEQRLPHSALWLTAVVVTQWGPGKQNLTIRWHSSWSRDKIGTGRPTHRSMEAAMVIKHLPTVFTVYSTEFRAIQNRKQNKRKLQRKQENPKSCCPWKAEGCHHPNQLPSPSCYNPRCSPPTPTRLHCWGLIRTQLGWHQQKLWKKNNL